MNWTVGEVIASHRKGGHTFAAVHFVDDRYGITIDGEPLRVFFWFAGQKEDCVVTMLRIAEGYPAGADEAGEGAAERPG